MRLTNLELHGMFLLFSNGLYFKIDQRLVLINFTLTIETTSPLLPCTAYLFFGTPQMITTDIFNFQGLKTYILKGIQ